MHWNSGGGRNRSDLPRKKTVTCYKKTQEELDAAKKENGEAVTYHAILHAAPQKPTKPFPATVD